jgi:hypothetical protein
MDAALPQLELQQELQRFTTQFADRVTQATETLERSAPPKARDEALRKNLLYVSSAMEIVSGPVTEINLLDMIVFMRLSRTVLENHWIPTLYGEEAGAELSEVFARSEQDLAQVAAQTLDQAQREQLDRLVEQWLADNPHQVRVEGIRLADFSQQPDEAEAGRRGIARGLLSSVKTASRAANQALSLSERGLFLLHRMPFLWRLQARLAAREMMGDAVEQLSEGPDSVVARALREGQALALRALLWVSLIGGGGMVLWWLTSLVRR